MKCLLILGFLLYLAPAIILASNHIEPPYWYFIGLTIICVLVSIGMNIPFNINSSSEKGK